MAQQIINIGTTADDGTGDALREAMDKANDNFSDIYENIPVEQSIILTAAGQDITASTGVATFRTRAPFTLETIYASVSIAPVGSSIEIDVKLNTWGVFYNVLTIDAGETDSVTAAIPAVLSAAYIPANAEWRVDVIQVGSTTPGQQLTLTLEGKRNLL